MAATDSAPLRVFGLDFGSATCVLSTTLSSEPNGATLVPNELSGLTTPTLISMDDKRREIGEGAVSRLKTDPSNTVSHLPILLSHSYAEFEASDISHHIAFATQPAEDGNSIAAEIRGTVFTAAQATAMLLGKLHRDAHVREAPSAARSPIAVAVPHSFAQLPAAVQRIREAGEISGVWDVQVISSSSALAAYYANKHTTFEGNALLLSIGAHYLSGSVHAFNAGSYTLVRESGRFGLGGAAIDEVLYARYVKEAEAKFKTTISSKSRSGKRLQDACKRLKHLLSSGVPEARVDVENIANDTDMHLTLSRAEFDELCAPLARDLKEYLQQLVEGVEVAVVELVGGGSRIPVVQSSVREVFSNTPVQFTMDSASAISLGATYLCAGLVSGAHTDLLLHPEVAGLPKEEIARLAVIEQDLLARDNEATLRGSKHNQLESLIVEMRGAGSGKHRGLVDTAVLRPIIERYDNWLMDESDDASVATFEEKIASFNSDISAAFPQYFAKLAEEKAETEAELQRMAEEREAEERDAEGKEDHDFRKLKKADRLNLVTKNKEEGNELFKDGNVEMAAMRYIKALQHCDKFFDLSEDDKTEINAVKLSLHLNLSMCYLKLEQYAKASKKCDEALDIDPKNVKALFRRAQAKQGLKDLDGALADAKAAGDLEPEDSAVKNLQTRLKALKKKETDKEKATYGKMFGL